MAQSFSTNLGLGPIPEFNSTQYPEIFNDLTRIRRALVTIQGSLDKYTGAVSLDAKLQGNVGAAQSVRVGNLARLYVKASTALSYGQVVQFSNSSGLIASKASANSPGLLAKAFCNGAVAAGSLGEFILLGVLSGLSGLVPGAPYYLSNIAGYIAPAPGVNSQYLGYALSTTELYFIPQLT